MNADVRQNALALLRRALADPAADFRDGQWEAIESLYRQRARLLVVQRTGWGKSVVYFVATRLLRDAGAGPTLLISPLLALMRNQIAAAERLGLRADTINSGNREEWNAVRRRIGAGNVDILLISPERLANDDFRDNVLRLVADNTGLLVVDEAHCISDWGHDFRPDYGRIVRIIQALPRNLPVLATTATANNRVVEDVSAQLGVGLRVIRGPLARASLRLQNITLPSHATRMAWLAERLPHLNGSGIIYALTVRDAQRLAAWLQSQGIDAYAYWGGQDTDVRVGLEQRLLDNQVKALVATSALGMGFDKPDLSFVIHYQRPSSVVHYYQQVGRAGRALADAYGILLCGHEDDQIADYFIRTAFPPEAHCVEVLTALDEADNGLTSRELEQQVNLSATQIEKVLKSLAVKSPAPLTREDGRWYATAVRYVPDTEKQERPLLPEGYAPELAAQAIGFLRGLDITIDPRKRWPPDALIVDGWRGAIAATLQAEPGRALCSWGDDGWGQLVRQGKQGTGRFDDALVAAVVTLMRDRWRPEPFPTWVPACRRSLTRTSCPTSREGWQRRWDFTLSLVCARRVTPSRRKRCKTAINKRITSRRPSRLRPGMCLPGQFCCSTTWSIPAGPSRWLRPSCARHAAAPFFPWR